MKTTTRRDRATRNLIGNLSDMTYAPKPRLVYSGPDPVSAMKAMRDAGLRGMERDGEQVYLYCAPGDDARATTAGNAMLDAGISHGVCF